MIESLKDTNKRVLIFTKLSYIFNLIFGLFKIMVSIFSKSIMFLIYAFYNFGLALAKKRSLNEEKEAEKNYLIVGITIILSSIVYVLYAIYMLKKGNIPNYHMYIVIGITIITFINIILSINGIIKAKKENNLKNESIKLIDLASSIILISLAQTAILSLKNSGDMRKYYAIGDIVFGSIAAMIGVYMIIRINKIKND